MDLLEQAYIWFMGLSDQYGVNPIVFGSIYVGAIPFFMASVAWLVRNVRRGASIVLPALSTTFFFISAYLYLIFAGENVPLWIYAVIVVMISYGGWSTYKKIQTRINEHAEPTDGNL